jgi:acetyl-CoA carboxylase beta subunit
MANQNLYNEIARDISNVQMAQANALANQNECCCNTKMLIQQTSAETNANLTAQIQSVKDMIAQNKIEALQAQVSQLQLAQATNGMLKFPDSWSYGAGAFPPIYGCNNI